MNPHRDSIEQAERLGFGAIWVRDLPLYDPDFGDAGQVVDPWVCLGAIAARAGQITLGTAAVVLPLRHPLHTAKAAASVDRLSEGRLIMGVATGDRSVEFPIFDANYNNRNEMFRSIVETMRHACRENNALHYVDPLPKPLRRNIPLIVVGGNCLLDYLYEMEDVGVNHFTFSFIHRRRPVGEVLQELAEAILPHFPALHAAGVKHTNN